MLSFKILENGDLEISVTDKERFDEMIEEAIEKEIAEYSYMNIDEANKPDHVPDPLQRDLLMYEVFEDLMCNSELRWMDAAQIGALTDAPLIGNYDPEDEDDPQDLIDGLAFPKLLWYYNWYALRSPVVDLWRDGKTIFNSAD
jgi:hypothetical protein